MVDLLPERSADSPAEWLLQLPGVMIISRDRDGVCAGRPRRGAPNTTQVLDRFRLLKNLREALEPLPSREHAHLARAAVSARESPNTSATAQPANQPAWFRPPLPTLSAQRLEPARC